MPFLLLFALPLNASAVAVDLDFLAGAADFFGAAILVGYGYFRVQDLLL